MLRIESAMLGKITFPTKITAATTKRSVTIKLSPLLDFARKRFGYFPCSISIFRSKKFIGTFSIKAMIPPTINGINNPITDAAACPTDFKFISTANSVTPNTTMKIFCLNFSFVSLSIIPLLCFSFFCHQNMSTLRAVQELSLQSWQQGFPFRRTGTPIYGHSDIPVSRLASIGCMLQFLDVRLL